MREREGERSYCTQYGTSSTGRGAPGKTGLHIRTYVRIRVHSELYREKGEWGGLFFLLLCTKRAFQGEKRRSLGFPPFPPPRLPPPSTLGGAVEREGGGRRYCARPLSPFRLRVGEATEEWRWALSLSVDGPPTPLLPTDLDIHHRQPPREEEERGALSSA